MRVLPALVKAGAAAADVLPRRPGVTILIYHRVGGGSGLAIDQPVPLFERQMAELAAAGVAITLDEAVARLAEGDPAAGVVVTFDDGTADFAEHAVPVLVRHGVPAYLYLATDFVESGRPFPDEGRPLSWSGLRDCVATGLVGVGSHTHRHALLDRLPRAEVEDELDRSVGLVEDRLGVRPAHFAYPKAVLGSPVAEAAVRTRFRSAAVAGTRPNVAGRANLYRLARSPVQVADGMFFFRRKVSGGMRLEDAARQLVNRRRYAGATT